MWLTVAGEQLWRARSRDVVLLVSVATSDLAAQHASSFTAAAGTPEHKDALHIIIFACASSTHVCYNKRAAWPLLRMQTRSGVLLRWRRLRAGSLHVNPPCFAGFKRVVLCCCAWRKMCADPQRRAASLETIARGQLTMQGPVTLLQGWRGAVARLPVFIVNVSANDTFKCVCYQQLGAACAACCCCMLACGL